MSKTWKIILWLLAVVIAIIVASKMFRGDNGIKEVLAEKGQNRNLVETVSASGKIQPEIEVKIQSEVSGMIVELPVKEGDQVVQGQLLVRINPDLYTSAYNRSEATLNSAKSNLSSSKARLAQAEAQYNVNNLNYQRQKKLLSEGVISQSEFETITSTWETSKAEVEAAKENIKSAEFSINSAQAGVIEAADNLKRTVIKSPMTGTVTALSKELGEAVLGNSMMSGEVIMKISALNTMEVNVEVNESDIVRVKSGDTTQVEVDSYRDQKFKGVVTEIGNTALNALSAAASSIDQVTNFSVKIRILPESYKHLCEGKPEGYSPFRPGMSATVEIETSREKDVLTIPIKAVTSRDDTTSASFLDRLKKKDDTPETPIAEVRTEPYTVVFVVNQMTNQAQIKVVETGIQDDRYIHIKSGLSIDDQVITGPYEEISKKLTTGDKVVVKSSLIKESDKEGE